MRKILLFMVAGALACGSSSPPSDGGTTNQAPVIKSMSAAQQSLAMGQSTALTADATDVDGDVLTYSWAQTAPASPLGTFSSPTAASPTWTAPTVAVVTAFILSVTVSDGHGHSPSGTVKVFAKTSTDPSFSADVQPLLLQCFEGCHTPDGVHHPLADYATMLSYHTVYACTGQRLVKPGDPDNSVLPKTMAGSSCGPQMPPPNGPYLGTDKIDLVRTWITQGAPNN